MALMVCPDCSSQVSDQATSCPKCGRPLQRNASVDALNRPPKSRTVAIVLAFFLGGIGAHKFYVNKPGVGILYVLFCWSFMPALVGLAEAIQYLCMSEEVFKKKYYENKL